MPKIEKRMREPIKVDDQVYYAGEPFEDIKPSDVGTVREVDDTIFEGYLVEFRGKHAKDEDEHASIWTEKYWIDMAELDHVPVKELKTTK